MSIQSYGKNDFHMQNLYIPRAPVRKVSNKYMYLINIILKENYFERRCRKDCPCIYTLAIIIQSKWNRVSCEEKNISFEVLTNITLPIEGLLSCRELQKDLHPT